MRYLIVALVSLIAFSFVPSDSYAYYEGKFDKDGYRLELKWQQKKDVFEVYGQIRGGEKNCNQLTVKINYSNSKNGATDAWVETFIKSYKRKQWNKFIGKDKIYTDKNDLKHYHVDRIFIDCL